MRTHLTFARYLKRFVKLLFSSLGLNLSRNHIFPNILIENNISLVLDVGANLGQFVRDIRGNGYLGKVVSFEPLPDAHDHLSKLSLSDPNWTIHERCALGAKDSITSINISKNSYSSSILEILPTHLESAPDSQYVSSAQVNIITLDSIFNNYATKQDIIFLKIDTQGFEHEVLSGLKNNLHNIKIVQLELSTVELYKDQRLFNYFFDFFILNGFSLWNIEPNFTNPKSGKLLQFDAIFIKD